jgi:predicted RNase H-like nuclease (RuvC/YqgF family)
MGDVSHQYSMQAIETAVTNVIQKDSKQIIALEQRQQELLKEIAQLKKKQNTVESRLGSISPRSQAKVGKLTAIARGFMARAGIRRIKIHHAAKASGVLVAMKKTVQGNNLLRLRQYDNIIILYIQIDCTSN